MNWLIDFSATRVFHSGVEARKFARDMRRPGLRVTVRRRRQCFDSTGAFHSWTVRIYRKLEAS